MQAIGIIADEVVYFRYRYDGLNRRVSTLEPVMPELWTKKQYYYNENWQVVDEWVDWTDDSEAPSSPDWYASYVWDLRYIDSPITRKMANPEHQVYYLNDANFNITAVIDTRSIISAVGDVSERYVYDPYGQVTVLHGDRDLGMNDTSADEWRPRTSNDYGTDVLFAGYRYERALRLYHVRHRVYHPTLGRWMQRDPEEYIDGPSLYTYCSNRPTTIADPFGTDWVEPTIFQRALGAEKYKRPTMKDAQLRALALARVQAAMRARWTDYRHVTGDLFEAWACVYVECKEPTVQWKKTGSVTDAVVTGVTRGSAQLNSYGLAVEYWITGFRVSYDVGHYRATAQCIRLCKCGARKERIPQDVSMESDTMVNYSHSIIRSARTVNKTFVDDELGDFWRPLALGEGDPPYWPAVPQRVPPTPRAIVGK